MPDIARDPAILKRKRLRQAILAEWCEEGEQLEHLVRHILIHEVGHHFGISDARLRELGY